MIAPRTGVKPQPQSRNGILFIIFSNHVSDQIHLYHPDRVNAPITSTMSDDFVCGNCIKPNATKKCEGCETMFYCDQNCQLSHWKLHKMLCKKKDTKNEKQHNYANSYKDRINTVLDIQHKVDCDHNDNDIYHIIHKLYDQNGGIIQFIKDHAHYMENIDIDQEYLQFDGKCDMINCPAMKREYRDRTVFDNNVQQRKLLYANCKDEDGIIVQQFMDQLHIARYHVIDMAMRSDNNLEDTDFDQIQPLIKGETFNKTRGDTNKATTNKFVTQLMEHKEDNDDECVSKTGNLPNYWQGMRFFYHDYFKLNDESQTMSDDAGYTDYANCGIREYTFKDWHIEPKHKNIKQEVLNEFNPSSITIIQYKNTFKKCKSKYNALSKRMMGAKELYSVVYEIPKGTKIDFEHIFSIMLYCNHTNLSLSFSRSYRWLSSTESDQSLKQRHAEFGNWTKKLLEAVECYGTYFEESQISELYHGISGKMVFTAFEHHFCAPTSTTTHRQAALTFAQQNGEKGIIITLKSDASRVSFFNCISFSDYPLEFEMLLVGGFRTISIIGLYSLDDRSKYDDWILTMKLFEGIFMGVPSNIAMQDKNKQQMNLLMDDYMNNEDIPFYIRQLFENWLRKTPNLCIDIDVLTKDICGVSKDGDVFYGYKSVAHCVLKDENRIN